jgi:ribose transport system permease protein
VSEPVAAPPVEKKKSDRPSWLAGPAGRNLGLVAAIVLICIVGVITGGERFASIDNVMVILRQAAIIGVLAVGMTFVITSGGIDLSVGSVMGLATVWATTLSSQSLAEDTHWLMMAVTAMLVGTIAGLVNGLIIAYGRVVPFIATLAMLAAARGLAEMISNRQTQRVEQNGFVEFFRLEPLGVPILVWIFVVVAVAGWFLLNRTTFGRRTVAVGGNAEASRLAGIKVQRHTLYLYGLAGLSAGIAAVVIGGTLLIGGRGTIVGTVLGVLIFAMLNNVFILNNLSTSAQQVAKGVIIVAAVLLQQRFANRTRST